MRLDKLTTKAREALQEAATYAEKAGHAEIHVEHLLAALLDQKEGIVPSILSRIGARPDDLSTSVRRYLGRLPKVSGGGAGAAGLSRELSAVLESAGSAAERFRDDYVSTEHLLLALAESEGSEASRIL